MIDTSKNVSNNGNNEDLMVGEDEGEGSVASVEDQIRKEMTVYEVSYLVTYCIIYWPI